MRTMLALTLAVAALCGADTYEDGDRRPMLGVEMSPVPLNIQNTQGLGPDEGVLVRRVFPGTAAAQMGIQPGDVITTINGAPIASMTDLRNTVSAHEVGDPVNLQVRRNGQNMPLASAFETWPNSIPYDKIDADAERRFKEWQQRRQARHQGSINQLAQDLDGMKKQLDGPSAAPFSQATALQQAKMFLRLMPAWTFAYDYKTDAIQPAPGIVPDYQADPAATPWQAVMVTSTRYRML